MTVRDNWAKTPRGSILADPKTKRNSRPHGRIGQPAIIAVNFTIACVRERQSMMLWMWKSRT